MDGVWKGAKGWIKASRAGDLASGFLKEHPSAPAAFKGLALVTSVSQPYLLTRCTEYLGLNLHNGSSK